MDSFDFKGRKALVRVDLNVPLDAQFNVTDDNRTKAIVPTVKKVLKEGGSVILMSHLGRPKGCLLYTSDAADERSSVDLGGRRIIKKKTKDYRRRVTCSQRKKDYTNITRRLHKQQ